jgi:UDP:flavonoid glycosyltransferase YjiC (YdhE family)
MRVLCSTPPMEGALGPSVALGQALTELGHELLVATGPDLQERLAGLGFASVVAGPGAMEGAIEAMGDPGVQAAAPDEHWQFPSTMFAAVIAPRKLPALRAAADEFQPDLVLHPPVDLAGPLLAAERGLPSACYGFAFPLEPDVVAAMAERMAPLWTAAGLQPDPHAGMFRGSYLDPTPPALRSDRGPAVAISAPIRPELPGDPHAPLPAWAQRLGERPTVYVSLGTVPLFNQPARFVALLETLAHDDVELVVTVGELNDPAALGDLPDTVHIERWLPLAPLLPQCDAVVCHAGTGTMLAALTAGLPLVLTPIGADQFTNAAACTAAGVARTLMQDQVTPDAIRDAVQAVLAPDAPERVAARGLGAEIAAMPAAAAVVRDLDRATRQHGQLRPSGGVPVQSSFRSPQGM